MRKNNGIYNTLDAYLAGFLTLHEFTPDLISENAKILFSFQDSKELQDTLKKYYSGERVDALQYAIAIKGLKTRIFSLRRNNEHEYNSNR